MPDVLYAKDPLIFDTKEKHRLDNENIYLERNPYKSEIKSTLTLFVSDKSMNRALLIYETIIKALKFRSHDIKIKENKTFAIVNGEEISINITEKTKQDPNTVDDYGNKGTLFSGELSFNINYNYWYKFTFKNKSTFNDTKFTKLEDKIISIIANLEVNSEQIKEERIESELQAKKKGVRRKDSSRIQSNTKTRIERV